MHRMIFVGSPRANGRSGALAEAIFDACIEDAPHDGVSVVSVAGMKIAGCIGCDGCKKGKVKAGAADYGVDQAVNENAGSVAAEHDDSGDQDPLAPCEIVADSDSREHNCIFEDDMIEVRKHLDAADELIVVCPTYFAGVPSQAKAVLDRLQPYFWSDIRSHTAARRPMTLHIIGEGAGGDPYGAQGLVTSVRSAFGVCGFRLERLLDWTGCITEGGEIVADAREVVIERAARKHCPQGEPANDTTANLGDNREKNNSQTRQGSTPRKKPKLDVHSANKRNAAQAQSGQRTQDSKPARASKGGKPNTGGAGSKGGTGSKRGRPDNGKPRRKKDGR
jgi:multimeric flavodoxin WrbA